MTIEPTTLELASVWIANAHAELIAEIKAGKSVETLAAKIAADYEESLSDDEREDTAGDVDEDDFEEALWSILRSDLIAAAETAGAEAVRVGDETISPTWPHDAIIDVKAIAHTAKIKGTPRRALSEAICRKFRESYAATYAETYG